VAAVVYAPSTEKARTTYLDWLERNGYMNRADRQAYRRNMVAERLEDPQGVSSDVVLHYGYQTAQPMMRAVPSVEPERAPQQVQEPVEESSSRFPIEELAEVPEEGPTMPIQKIMLRGYS
jgi:hypothetical protein